MKFSPPPCAAQRGSLVAKSRWRGVENNFSFPSVHRSEKTHYTKPARPLSALARASRRRRALSKNFWARKYLIYHCKHTPAGVCIISLACAPRRRMLIARNGADRVSTTHSLKCELCAKSRGASAGEAGRLLYRLARSPISLSTWKVSSQREALRQIVLGLCAFAKAIEREMIFWA